MLFIKQLLSSSLSLLHPSPTTVFVLQKPPKRETKRMGGEIYVVTGHGHGHLHPCMEICKLLSSRNYHAALVIPSTLSASIPSSFSQNPLTTILQISPSPRIPLLSNGPDPQVQLAAEDLATHLSNRKPLCAVIDFQMGWTKEVFWKFDVPVASLFTFGACAAAMELGAWKVHAGEIASPEESRVIPGLPQEMAVTYWDLKRKPFGFGGGVKRGPPSPGDRPPWAPLIEGSAALLFNTCDDLDGEFRKYAEEQLGIPAWGVGPLLPDKYWKSSLISDREIRENNINSPESNVTEEEVIQWLDSKPRGSVLYVAFGSAFGPTTEEYHQLASALDESTHPFIWVVQRGSAYYPRGLGERVGDRGLVIHGWAPQLLILSHISTGGFLSHCGWNSTAEAVGRGVPFLAWPIMGDQHYNAKLVVNYLKVGYKVALDMSQMVRKEDIVKGIEKVMGDEEIRRRAKETKGKFDGGFPASSEAALDAFIEFINHKASAN